jgi:hypothetical protein
MTPTKPPLGLDEIQEEDPRELQEGQPMAVLGLHRPGEAGTQVSQSTAELLKEATPYCF